MHYVGIIIIIIIIITTTTTTIIPGSVITRFKTYCFEIAIWNSTLGGGGVEIFAVYLIGTYPVL